MNCTLQGKPGDRKHRRKTAACAGLTLVELMVAIGAGSLVLAGAVTMWLFVLRGFTAVGNYSDLDAKSRFTVDSMLNEMRQASRVVGFQRTGTNNWLSLTNAQAAGTGVTYTWDITNRKLVRQKPNEADRVYLTECDLWDFQLYQRTPHPGGVYVFYPATNASGVLDTNLCKLVNMTWKCSRTVLGKKANTENVQTAQVVLRNKQ
jgi:hypothetical protein